MSLEYLPLEIFQAIAHPFAKNDFLSLCLVSKRILSFARPHLYTSSQLVISNVSFQDDEEDVDTDSWAKRKRNLFFRTLQNSPLLAKYIRSLHLTIDPHALNPKLIASTKNLLIRSVNLRQFTISRPGKEQLGYVPFEILQVVPTTVASLRIEYRPLSVEGIYSLLAHLDQSTELDMSKCDWLPLPTEPLDPITTVTTLDLSHADADWSPFLAAFIPAVSSLSSLAAPFVSLRTLKSLRPQQASQLTRLELYGTPRTSYSSWYSEEVSYSSDPLNFLIDLASLLGTTPHLEVLTVHVVYCYTFYLPPAHSYSLLEHLPKSLTHLHLKAPDIVPTKALLPYLGSPIRSSNLRSLELCFETLGDEDSEALRCRELVEDQIEELCEDRGIELRWLSWP